MSDLSPPVVHLPWAQWQELQARIRELEAERERLLEAVGCVSRMRLFPDNQVNNMTLSAAIRLADAALTPTPPGATP
jgi:hypothetical protein